MTKKTSLLNCLSFLGNFARESIMRRVEGVRGGEEKNFPGKSVTLSLTVGRWEYKTLWLFNCSGFYEGKIM